MERYLIRPKKPQALHIDVPRYRIFNIEHRKTRLNTLNEISLEDPVYREVGRWLKEADPHAVKMNLDFNRLGGYTGTVFVEMSEQEAQQIEREVKDVSVIKDGPLNLIDTFHRLVSNHVDELGEQDLWHQEAIGLTAARKRGFPGSGKGVVVAVLDTGIDRAHPEISASVQEEAYDIKKAFERNPDLQDMGSLAERIKVPGMDTDGHGTHVAGLICGKKVGVAPGAKVLNEIMLPYKEGTKFYYILAMQLAIHLSKEKFPGLRLVNMSAGIVEETVPELREEVLSLVEAGILPVFATGNEGRNSVRSPARFVEPLSVGAIGRWKDGYRVASFSSGATITTEGVTYTVPDLVAPGDDVYSCRMGGGYEARDGTSMAAPIVSGVAALILEKHPDIMVSDLIGEIMASCKVLPNYPENRQGSGIVQTGDEL